MTCAQGLLRLLWGGGRSWSATGLFIPPVESYQKTLKTISTASLLGARHSGEVVENKPASSLVAFLGKALNGTPYLYVEDR